MRAQDKKNRENGRETCRRIATTRLASAGLCVLAVLALVPACREAQPAQPVNVTPPVFFDELEGQEERFLGKSMVEIRRMLRSTMDAPVTLSVRSSTLQAVVRELSEQSGLGIAITPDALATARDRPIDLDVREMPARYVLDWLTRLIDAHYTVEGPGNVFITRDRAWASRDRLRMRGYSIGALRKIGRPVVTRVDRPGAARYDRSYDAQRLIILLSDVLRHTTKGHPDARMVVDETGSRLSAMLPPRGHAKLASILDEAKRPRQYEPPPADDTGLRRAALLATPVTCDFPRQDVRRIADDLGHRANVNIGFDYRLIDGRRRTVSLALGETTLDKALAAFAAAAGLGKVVAEPGDRFWILGKDQTARTVSGSGELPWDRAGVRSHYIAPLVDQFGIDLVFRKVQQAVTDRRPDSAPIGFVRLPEDRFAVERTVHDKPAAAPWNGDFPVIFYHAATGRLVVIDEDEVQKIVAQRVAELMGMLRPPPVGEE